MNTTEWILIRATGMSAVVLLTASMVLGLMLSLRMRPKRWPAVVTNDIHQFVTSLALWVTGAHLALLIIDNASGIGLRDLVIPFLTSSQRIAMGVGTIAVLALAVVWVSSINRTTIGHSRWRTLHYTAFLAYVMAIAHGIFGGTDTSQMWAWPVYAASIAIVGWLTMTRIRTARNHAQRRPAPPVTRPAVVTAQQSLPPITGTALPVLEHRPVTQTGPRKPVRL
jgi:sulfoxide reductase heme-binding subunit YedZ